MQGTRAACILRRMEMHEAIRKLRERSGLSQSELARQVGVRPQSVQQWEDPEGTSPRRKLWPKLTQALGATEYELLKGPDAGDRFRVAETRGTPYDVIDQVAYVPLISWVQAGAWQEAADPYQPGDCERMVAVTRNVSETAFALRVRGDSMEPRFPEGSIIVVDPDREPENGSFVVVRMEEQAEVTFKQLVIDAGVRMLKPLNERYPIMEINGHATVVGVVRQLVMDID